MHERARRAALTRVTRTASSRACASLIYKYNRVYTRETTNSKINPRNMRLARSLGNNKRAARGKTKAAATEVEQSTRRCNIQIDAIELIVKNQRALS